MSMVEKVARAIDPEAFEPPLPGNTKGLARFYAVCRERQNMRAIERARAAIEAMREPTDSMKVAGGLKCEAIMFEGEGGVIFNDMGEVFTAMIDAALKGEAE